MKLLRPIELAYQQISGLRRTLYRKQILKQRRLPRPVVSIGNLSFGGSGKTPATVTIARLLQANGFRVAILTRGYGRTGAPDGVIVDGPDAGKFGDEPVLMSRLLPQIPVVVGRSRHRSGLRFLEHDDCDLFLLDDAFQHVQLHRDCDIVLLGSGAALRRDSFHALRRVHVVLLRDDALAPREARDALRLNCELRPVGWRVRGELRPVAALRGIRLVAFSGLANNQQFFGLLASLGADVVAAHSFRDHHRYTEAELARLQSEAEAAGAELVTTAKDAAKLRSDSVTILEVELEIDEPDTLMQHLSKHVVPPAGAR